MHVYSLTRLTGARKDEDRHTVILRWEVRRHVRTVTLLALAVSLPVSGILFILIGGYAFVVAPLLIVPAAHVLFAERQRKGLKVTRAQALMNRRRRETGKFYINGTPFRRPEWIMHVPAVIESSRDETAVNTVLQDLIPSQNAEPGFVLGTKSTNPARSRGNLVQELA